MRPRTTNLALLSFLWALSPAAAASDVKLVTVTNGTAFAAAGLSITFSGAGGTITVPPYAVMGLPGCPVPGVPSNGAATSTAVLSWGSTCVSPGASVTFVAATTSAGPLGFAAAAAGSFWMDASGTSLGALGAGSVSLAPMLGMPAGSALPVAVTAPVLSPTGGPLGTTVLPPVIGTILATVGGCSPFPSPGNVKATFTLDPAYTWTDVHYDFKWVQVITAYLDGGAMSTFPAANLFALPAIDPAPCVSAPAGAGCVPASGAIAADDYPYFISEAYFASPPPGATPAHVECASSTMCDFPMLGLGVTDQIAVYSAYLVVDDGDNPTFGPMSFGVLAGFSWYYNDATGAVGILGALPPETARIADALALGPAPFPSWTPIPPGPALVIGAPSFTLKPWLGVGCFPPGIGTPALPKPTIYTACSPKFGDPTFTFSAKVLPPAPPGSFGGPVLYTIAPSVLASPTDLLTLGFAVPPATCFVYLPIAFLAVGSALPGPTGLWSQTLPLPADPSLIGLDVYLQAFQPAFSATGAFAGVAVTPYLGLSILP